MAKKDVSVATPVVTKIIGEANADGFIQVNIDGDSFGNVIGKEPVMPCESKKVGAYKVRRFMFGKVALISRHGYDKDEQGYVSRFYMKHSDAKTLLDENGEHSNAFGVDFDSFN